MEGMHHAGDVTAMLLWHRLSSSDVAGQAASASGAHNLEPGDRSIFKSSAKLPCQSAKPDSDSE